MLASDRSCDLGLGLVYKLNLNVDDENHHFIDVIPQ